MTSLFFTALVALSVSPVNAKPVAKPLKVFILAGQSNMEGHAKVATFDYIGDDPKTAPLLSEMRGSEGKPRVCDKVWISYLTGDNVVKQGKLTAGYGALGGELKIGPEFTFGITMEKLLKEPVLIIKTAWGGKSLHTDFRSPSGATTEKATGSNYRLMIDHVKKVLTDIGQVIPDYDPKQGYELSGFVWFQGWNDLVASDVYPKRQLPGGYDLYSNLLTLLIRDVRKDLSAPKMKFVIGVMGVGGILDLKHLDRNATVQNEFRTAMEAPTKLEEFRGNVVAVQTAPFWDAKLGAISDKYDQVRQKSRQLSTKNKNAANADGSMTAQQQADYVKEFEAKLITPEEAAMWKRGASNAGYHYLGCAKTFALAGQAFAKMALPNANAPIKEMSLVSALKALKGHLSETSVLTGEEITKAAESVTKNSAQFGADPAVATQAFELSELYENRLGPLFINKETKGGFPRKPKPGIEIHRALFAVQQGLIDHAFSKENLAANPGLLTGKWFKTSEFFPGKVAAAVDRQVVHEAQINASQPAHWGSPVMDYQTPARRPTGCYLAPGSIATVTVPPALVGKGFRIRVGAHSWNLEQKPNVQRLDRVSLGYPIDSTETLIANPVGGGIYVEVPYLANAGLVKVKIKNAVRSPFFSGRSFSRTTLDQWLKTERLNPAPWADFESDKFMMQVPTSWIYNYSDPVRLMKDWDKSMDVVSTLFGFPLVRPKTVLYLQVDVAYRGSANFPGYPQSNLPYNPNKPEKGNSNHWLLRGPQFDGEITFHELGHAHMFTKFTGETEAAVNVPYVAVLNTAFRVDLQTAFGRSFSKPYVSLDVAATTWMVAENFRKGKPMDTTNSTLNEMRYQHRGYAKYVEIADLFGWKTLNGFWRSVNDDFLQGIKYPTNTDPTDSRILRLSQQAGADLTPLIHFWGVHPENKEALKREMLKRGLKPSRLIYDRLVHYRSVIPMNREQFAVHAKTVNPKGIRPGQAPEWGEGWYESWLAKFSESEGAAIQAALQRIIDTYFPTGRP